MILYEATEGHWIVWKMPSQSWDLNTSESELENNFNSILKLLITEFSLKSLLHINSVLFYGYVVTT